MNKAKFKYLMGSFFLLIGALLMTVIPRIIDMTELLFVPQNNEFLVLAFGFIVIGNIFYLVSHEYYKKQLFWIACLFLYYFIFQACFLMGL